MKLRSILIELRNSYHNVSHAILLAGAHRVEDTLGRLGIVAGHGGAKIFGERGDQLLGAGVLLELDQDTLHPLLLGEGQGDQSRAKSWLIAAPERLQHRLGQGGGQVLGLLFMVAHCSILFLLTERAARPDTLRGPASDVPYSIPSPIAVNERRRRPTAPQGFAPAGICYY